MNPDNIAQLRIVYETLRAESRTMEKVLRYKFPHADEVPSESLAILEELGFVERTGIHHRSGANHLFPGNDLFKGVREEIRFDLYDALVQNCGQRVVDNPLDRVAMRFDGYIAAKRGIPTSDVLNTEPDPSKPKLRGNAHLGDVVGEGQYVSPRTCRTCDFRAEHAAVYAPDGNGNNISDCQVYGKEELKKQFGIPNRRALPVKLDNMQIGPYCPKWTSPE